MPVGLPACYPEIIHSAMLPLLFSGTLTAEDACPAIDCVGMRRANLHMCHHEATRRELTQPMQRQHATGGIIFAQQMPSNSPAASRWRCAARGAVRAHKAYRAALCFVLGAQGLRWGKPVYPIARGKMGKPSLPCANADTFGQILALPFRSLWRTRDICSSCNAKSPDGRRSAVAGTWPPAHTCCTRCLYASWHASQVHSAMRQREYLVWLRGRGVVEAPVSRPDCAR